MAKLEHYALDFDAIVPTLEEFFNDKEGIEFSFEQTNEFTYKVSVSKANIKKPGLLTIYNKQGLYCMVPGGTPALVGMCKDCCDFIKQRLQIPNAVRQSFSIKDVDSELAEACLVCLAADYTLSAEKGDVDTFIIAAQTELFDHRRLIIPQKLVPHLQLHRLVVVRHALTPVCSWCCRRSCAVWRHPGACRPV